MEVFLSSSQVGGEIAGGLSLALFGLPKPLIWKPKYLEYDRAGLLLRLNAAIRTQLEEYGAMTYFCNKPHGGMGKKGKE